MNIRPFQTPDKDEVIRLWTECGLVVPHNDPERDIERKLKVNPDWFLIGTVDGEIVATCMLGYDGHRGWINYLAVRPDMQHRGLGSMMTQHAENLARKVGCQKINLLIRATNRQVVCFYETLGYKQDPVVSMGKRLE